MMLLMVLFRVFTLPTGVLWSHVGGETELTQIGGRNNGLGAAFSPLNWPGGRVDFATFSLGIYSDRRFILVCHYFFYGEFGLLTTTKGWIWICNRWFVSFCSSFPFNGAKKEFLGVWMIFGNSLFRRSNGAGFTGVIHPLIYRRRMGRHRESFRLQIASIVLLNTGALPGRTHW